MPTFRTGRRRDIKGDQNQDDLVYSLTEEERADLCVTLLNDLGITDVREVSKGELVHACRLPWNTHKDQERNPTASLNYQKLLWNCLGSCQAGGSLLWFVGIMRDTSGTEARKYLANYMGKGEGEDALASLLRYFDEVYSPKSKKSREPIPYMDVRVLDPWMYIHPYLTEIRGIPEDNLVKHRVGYGIIKGSHRIVVPHFWKGKLVGWQTRRIVNDGTPKWLSSVSFPKDRTVYNYDPAQTAIIVEAPLSVVSKSHLAHMEATFGASIPDSQARLISMHKRVILFMDNDMAGWKSTRNLGKLLEPYSQVLVADNPWSADPADMDDDTFVGLVENAVPFELWQPPKEVAEWPLANTG